MDTDREGWKTWKTGGILTLVREKSGKLGKVRKIAWFACGVL